MADSYSPWAEEASGFDRLGGSISHVLLGLAQNRAGMARAGYEYDLGKQKLALDRQQTEQHGALYKAQAALYAAEQLLNQKKADKEQAINDTASQFGDTMGMLSKAHNGETPYYEPALRSMATGQAGRLAGLGQQHVAKNLAELSSMDDPRLRAYMATDTKLPTSLAVNHSPIDYLGNVQNDGRYNLSPGQTQINVGTGQQTTAPSTPYDFRRSIGSSLGPLVRYYGDLKEKNAAIIEDKGKLDPRDAQEQQTVGAAVNRMLQIINAQSDSMLNGSTAPVAQPQAQEQAGPKVGEVRKGYKFKGGNPADKNNWEKQ